MAKYQKMKYNLEMGERPLIYAYDDYRKFLGDLYSYFKIQNKKFSLRYFSRTAGFKTHSFLKEVIEGRSNLSKDSINKFAKAFKLAAAETDFFENLVFLNQASSAEEKKQYVEAILRSRAYRKIYPLKEHQLRYCTHWYYVVVREMVNLPTFREDPQWIAENTIPSITAKEALEAIEELLKLILLKRNENGRLVQSETILASADEVASTLVAQFHRQFMSKASESIDRIPRENRDISSVTFRVSRQTAKSIKEKIQKFRKELMEEASQDRQPEGIFQLNLQLFPVTPFIPDKK